MGQWNGPGRWAARVAVCLVLSGCMAPGGTGDDETVSRFGAIGAGGGIGSEATDESRSAVISALQGRQSILPPGSGYDQVAGAVLAANSRTAEAELRAARLRAEAASKNWLPKIGPNISLTSLSEVVATIFVEQVLFDHGRLRAERLFAKADVEVAAVGLAQDTNERLESALSLYLDTAEARERFALEGRTLKDMSHFQWVMNERVQGGVSDRSDLNVLNQKLAEIRARQAAAQEASVTAMAELNAMSGVPLDDVTGIDALDVAGRGVKSLAVLRAEAERDRDIAQAQVDRAGLLPGLTASGTTGSSSDGPDVTVGGGQLIGFGTGANLKAIEMAKDTAQRRVGQATEDAARAERRLEARIVALERQASEARQLETQAKANLDLFQSQYDAGQRQVMDVVGVYETYASRQSAAVDLKYELARTRLELARRLGLLADGSDI